MPFPKFQEFDESSESKGFNNVPESNEESLQEMDDLESKLGNNLMRPRSEEILFSANSFAQSVFSKHRIHNLAAIVILVNVFVML